MNPGDLNLFRIAEPAVTAGFRQTVLMSDMSAPKLLRISTPFIMTLVPRDVRRSGPCAPVARLGGRRHPSRFAGLWFKNFLED